MRGALIHIPGSRAMLCMQFMVTRNFLSHIPQNNNFEKKKRLGKIFLHFV